MDNHLHLVLCWQHRKILLGLQHHLELLLAVGTYLFIQSFVPSLFSRPFYAISLQLLSAVASSIWRSVKGLFRGSDLLSREISAPSSHALLTACPFQDDKVTRELTILDFK